MKHYSMPTAELLAVNETCDVIRTSGYDGVPSLSDAAGYGDIIKW